MTRAVGRISKRRKHSEGSKPPKPKNIRRGELTTLEQRITEAEQKKLALERSLADAFARRDYSQGRRAAKQLDKLKAQIDTLYEKWMEKNT